MAITRITPILNVADVPESLRWFEALGWKRAFSWNARGAIAAAADQNEYGPADFAGICTGEVDIFLSKTGPELRSCGSMMSWWLNSPGEVDAMRDQAKSLGYSVLRDPFDAPWGVREFHLRHPDGHVIRVGAELVCD